MAGDRHLLGATPVQPNAALMMVVAVLILMGVFGVPSQFSTPVMSKGRPVSIIGSLSRGPHSRSRRRRKVVFVDVTAEWCITCQVNKQVVTYRGDVAAALLRSDTILMRPTDASRSCHRRTSGEFQALRHSVQCRLRPVAPEGIPLPEI
jgi:suppressor for copper-sensitivity B